MRVECIYCKRLVIQAKNHDGPNYCPQCRHLFYVPEERQMPPWILGVLVILVANWQIVSQ